MATSWNAHERLTSGKLALPFDMIRCPFVRGDEHAGDEKCMHEPVTNCTTLAVTVLNLLCEVAKEVADRELIGVGP